MILCHDYEKYKKHIKFPCIVQEKYDGLRVRVHVYDVPSNYINQPPERYAMMYTRANKEIHGYTEIRNILETFPEGTYDGELLYSGDVRQTGNGKANRKDRTVEDEQGAYIVLWDYIPHGLPLAPYIERINFLRTLIHRASIDSRYVQFAETAYCDSMETLDCIYNGFIEDGLEGIVVKNYNLMNPDGRTKDCLKRKKFYTCDLVVVNMLPGEGRLCGTMGALRCTDSTGKLLVNVGSGFTDDQRYYWWSSQGEEEHIIEVKYNQIISDKRTPGLYSLFLPVFVKIRDDKTEADSVEEMRETCVKLKQN